jgi:hypothetical protein
MHIGSHKFVYSIKIKEKSATMLDDDNFSCTNLEESKNDRETILSATMQK